MNAAGAAKHSRSVKALAAGRPVSAANRSERANARDIKLYQMAVDYRKQHPDATSSKVVAYLRQFDEFKRLTDGGIEKKIKGTQRDALKALSTNRPT